MAQRLELWQKLNGVFEKPLEQLGTEARCRGEQRGHHFEGVSALSFGKAWAGCGAGPLEGKQKVRNAEENQEWWQLLPSAVLWLAT